MSKEIVLPQMTPDEFEAEYKGKGWNQSMLAERWGFADARRIRQIKANPNKNPYFIDAVKGLPHIMKL